MPPIPEIHHLHLAHHRVPEIWLSRSRTPHGVTRKHLLQTIRFREKAVKRKIDRRESARQ
jgi:hypothetical protein